MRVSPRLSTLRRESLTTVGRFLAERTPENKIPEHRGHAHQQHTRLTSPPPRPRCLYAPTLPSFITFSSCYSLEDSPLPYDAHLSEVCLSPGSFPPPSRLHPQESIFPPGLYPIPILTPIVPPILSPHLLSSPPHTRLPSWVSP